MITDQEIELFQEHRERHIVAIYGSGALFADSLIVEGRKLFGFDLNKAFDAYNGANTLSVGQLDALQIEYDNYFKKSPGVHCLKRINEIEHRITKTAYRKARWAGELAEYIDRYFNGRFDTAKECIERVALWKTWCTTVK